jgi:MFS family permease
MEREQAPQMAGRHAQRVREVVHGPAVVEEPALDEPQGLGVGNLTTLPGLILAVEWPRDRFGGLVGLVVGINQFTFAFGPSLVGIVRDWRGPGSALVACMVLTGVAGTLVLLGPGRQRPRG